MRSLLVAATLGLGLLSAGTTIQSRCSYATP
jgi:hypothetical protein